MPGSSPGDGQYPSRSDPRAELDGLPPAGLSRSPLQRILVLLGPTGTGKSAVALKVAERIGGEIVGCDALQVYRGLDAGTSKPTADDRARVPHWLVDVADPRSDYAVSDYVRAADAAIAAVLARGGVPIVVGGTGMYLRGLLKGIVPAPPRDEALRARLRALADRFGAPRLHRWLRSLDPATAERLPAADRQRIVRGLEVALADGPAWSERLASLGTWESESERYAALKFGLDLAPALLAERLAARVDAFLAAGLVEEVDRLRASGVPDAANALKGIGYRQVLRARLEDRDPTLEREAIVVATRQYAKRQRTWFRKERGVSWLDAASGADTLAAFVASRWAEALRPGGAGAAC